MVNTYLSTLFALSCASAQGTMQTLLEQHRSTELSLLEMPILRSKGSDADEFNQRLKTAKKPTMGFDKRLRNVSAQLPKTCESDLKKFDMKDSDSLTCTRTAKLVDLLLKQCVGQEPSETWEAEARLVLGIPFWLYLPGTQLAFQTLDKNGDGGIDLMEMSMQFPPQLLASCIASGVWDFMDTRGFEVAPKNNMTRRDLVDWMHSIIMLRHYLPSLDEFDSDSPTQKLMLMSRRALTKPEMPRARLPWIHKLASIFVLMSGAVAFHYVFLSGRYFKVSNILTGAKSEEETEEAATAAKKEDI